MPASAGDLQLAAAHRAFMQARGLQHDFTAVPAPKPPPAWIAQLIEALTTAAPVLKIVFWAGVALGAAALLWVIVRDLPFARGRRRRKPAVASIDWRPEAGAARPLLDDADRLAQSGLFGDAIHLLLFRSIEDIGAKRPEAVRAAFTSRDIVEAAPLSEDGRSAFRLITEAVERSFFGGRPAAADDFNRCRRQYEAFALAERRP
ncbi:DUF4129 domain-containing protein [Phenylobacterium sp. LjRoot225]|uniref:DUF4129 domain-containing protein n=1 Tax=Phenylobacterium sp. LjRoot225 TaxID=3342285 RepID=UPI003ECD59FE